jgi:predicted dehydrogenase
LLQTLLSLPAVEVRAVCDIARARAEQAQRLVEQKGGRRPEAYVRDEWDWRNLVGRDDLEVVIIATPWEWHAPMAVGTMRAGKRPGVEVPAAITLGECWDLVRTSEKTGQPCMMLENVCYFQNVLTLLRMVREGVFGELVHCEAGYQHDCRSSVFDSQGQLTWRGRHVAALNGNLYPTHPIGPVAQWLDINRGDRFVRLTSVSTHNKGLRQYAARRLGPEHPLARRDYAQGDVNTTLLQTAKGRTVTLYFDMLTPRPYDLILRLQGARGIYLGTRDQIYLEGQTATADAWEAFEPYQQKYAHPLWQTLAENARKSGGHGGSDYVMLYDFIRAARQRTPPPQDVYDAASWSAIFPLSIQSVAKGGQPVAFPDFTKGKWKTNPPAPVYGA